ncbi:MAG: TetR/AcrR family transcriptional regulator [Myxococcota bacterium]
MPESLSTPVESSQRTLSTKRARTRARLLANAVALFRRNGVRETRLAEVAKASDVAPATLFNHFPSRADLAGAWVRGEIESEADAVARAVRAGERGLRASLRNASRAIAARNAEEPVVRWAAWQEARRLRAGGVAGLRDAISLEQQREHVRGDRAPDVLADLLADAIEGGLVEGLGRAIEDGASSPPARVRAIASAILARVDLVLDGARKRNERVRPDGSLQRPQ